MSPRPPRTLHFLSSHLPHPYLLLPLFSNEVDVVHRVYNHLLGNEEWMEDLHAADVIFVASHSQGAIVSTHLIDRLIEDGHILTSRSVGTLARTAAAIGVSGAPPVPAAQAQKVCLLSLCGIHLGPLRYLKTSSVLQVYTQVWLMSLGVILFSRHDVYSISRTQLLGSSSSFRCVLICMRAPSGV